MEAIKTPGMTKLRFIFSVLWPAFLMACASCGVFFSFLDPAELGLLDERFYLSSEAIYTFSFLIFWAFGCISSGITAVLLSK